MIPDLLRKLGLSPGEIKIYSALLNLGSSPLNKIHERTGIERRNIYDILNKLIERGLVTYINENKKRVFQISHPSKLIGYLEEQKDAINQTKEEIQKELPQILGQFNSHKLDINAEVYRGYEGIKAVWEDMLNYPAVYWIGSGRYVPKQLPGFFAGWNRRRIKLKVKWYNLCRYELRKEVKPFPFEYPKFLPKEFSGNPGVIGIFGNKVANFLFEEEPFAFVISSKSIADNYRKYHKYLWQKVAKK